MMLSKKMKKCSLGNRYFGQKGLTLMELLIAMAMLSIVVGLFVAERIRQQDQEMTQQQAIEMQQTVRASLLLMTKELRMAGYDPESYFDAGITDAGDDYIDFSYADGGNLQNVSYRHADHGSDGDLDITFNKGGGGFNVLAENIETLNFEYLDKDGNILTIADPVPQSTLDMIRALRISITGCVDKKTLDRFPENNTRTLITTVKFRNLGL